MKLNPIASEARTKKTFPARAVGFFMVCAGTVESRTCPRLELLSRLNDGRNKGEQHVNKMIKRGQQCKPLARVRLYDRMDGFSLARAIHAPNGPY